MPLAVALASACGTPERTPDAGGSAGDDAEPADGTDAGGPDASADDAGGGPDGGRLSDAGGFPDGGVPDGGPADGGLPADAGVFYDDISIGLELDAETRLDMQVERTMAGWKFMAVDPSGAAYAIHPDLTGGSVLWASEDGARTWTRRGRLARGGFRVMTALRDGTLLADVGFSGGHALARSGDAGRTWTEVLQLGAMTLLTPHSIDELHGTVFAGEYQAWTRDSVPLTLWASTDRGRTWEPRHVFQNRRHIHGVRADRRSGALWVFFGDDEQRTGLVRSVDDGFTFDVVATGGAGSAVDGVFLDGDLLYGQDILYGPVPSAVCRVRPGEAPQRLHVLPGPSYSIHALRPGGFVVTTTREPDGDVYRPGDDAAWVLTSPDGRTWTEVGRYPRRGLQNYGRANVYWSLPSGELVLELANVTAVGSGYGYQLVRVEPVGP